MRLGSVCSLTRVGIPRARRRSLNTPNNEMAQFAARIARLEEELAETRRVNAAWRQLQERSDRILGRIAKRLADVLQADSRGDGEAVQAPLGEPRDEGARGVAESGVVPTGRVR
jgi:hypothetical protein